MKSLVLLDLDNVLQAPRQSEGWQRPTAWHLPDASKEGMTEYVPEAPAPARPAVFVEEGQGALPEDGVVVVIAFNQATAAARVAEKGVVVPLRPEYLLRLAEATVALLGISGEVRCEAIPVLTVPQSADGALLRALQHASSATVVGPFNQVVLVSADVGLWESIRKVLRVHPKFLGSKVFPFRMFRLPARHPHRRQAPPGARLSTASPVAPEGWSARVEDDEHIAAVQTRVVRWEGIQDFSSLADLLEERVELLSQLGPTRTSSRGVARLGACLNRGQVTLGPIHANDGLEIDNEGFEAGRVTSLSSATFGPGAFRLDNLRATLPTRLPAVVLREAVRQGKLTLGAPKLDLPKILRACWPTGGDIPNELFRLSTWCKHGKLFARVEPTDGKLTAWWLGKKRAQSEVSARIPSLFSLEIDELTQIFSVQHIARAYPKSTRRIHFAASRDALLSVVPQSNGWEVMTAQSPNGPVLVLLPPTSELPRTPEEPITVLGRRLQEYPWSGSDAGTWPTRPPLPCDAATNKDQIRWEDTVWDNFWDLLYRLPVLVACQHEPPATVSQ